MQAIITKFHGATNTKPSRVSATCYSTKKLGRRVMLSWDHGLDTEDMHRAAVNALCEVMGWTSGEGGYAWIPGAMPDESGFAWVYARVS